MNQSFAIFFTVLVCTVHCFVGSVHAAWETDLEVARSLAAQQNKLLLIHFWTPDCGPCKIVDKKVFPTAEVEQAIRQNYVPLKVNAYENTVLRDFFKVRRWPTDVIATVDGKELRRMTTPQDSRKYAQLLTSSAVAYRRSLAPTSQIALAPTQSSSQPTANRWSQNVAAPDLSENTARARRPGVAKPQNPAPLGGPMVPGVVAGPVADATTPNFATTPSNSTSGTSPSVASNAAPAPGAIYNRFTTDERMQQQVAPQVAKTEISNPYASPAAASQPGYQGSSLAKNSPTTSSSIPHGAAGSPASPSGMQAVQQPVAGVSGASGPTQNTPVAPASPSPSPSFGLDGRCPVTLVSQQRWVRGNQQWGAVHRGKTYLFAGQAEQQAFLQDPDKYSPVLAGMDVVALATSGSVAEGHRDYGVLYDDDGKLGPRPNRIYLFQSATTRDRFEADPESFVQPVMQALQRNQLHTLLR